MSQLTQARRTHEHLSRRSEQDLLSAGEEIVKVPPKLMANTRDAAWTYGKSDPIDAFASVGSQVLLEVAGGEGA